jgi:hypothetical protein
MKAKKLKIQKSKVFLTCGNEVFINNCSRCYRRKRCDLTIVTLVPYYNENYVYDEDDSQPF